MGGYARCSQSIRSHNRQVGPTGVAVFWFDRFKPIGIHHLACVGDVATQGDGVLGALGVKPSAHAANRPRYLEEHLPVRELRHLCANHAWREKRPEDVPPRAGTPETRQVEAGAAESFRDVPGDVNPNHMKRDSLGTFPA